MTSLSPCPLACLHNPGRSEKRMVPPNTRAVPAQWREVKGLEKYQIENSRLRNFLGGGVGGIWSMINEHVST